MREQRIDTAAEAATGTDADPGDGMGMASPASHQPAPTGAGSATASADDLPVTGSERSAPEHVDGRTEGERSLRAAAEASGDE